MKYCCYIEEYKNEQNKLCARFRDKVSNKNVSVTGKNADKHHLLAFLSQAKLNQDIMPSIYQRDGDDIVSVKGTPVVEYEDEIVVNIDIEYGGYVFE